MEMTPLLVAGITLIGTVLGGVVVAVLPKRGTAENALIDQLQEEIRARDDVIKAKDRTIARSRVRERRKDDYIEGLRMHISTEKGPPPPAWPDMGDTND